MMEKRRSTRLLGPYLTSNDVCMRAWCAADGQTCTHIGFHSFHEPIKRTVVDADAEGVCWITQAQLYANHIVIDQAQQKIIELTIDYITVHV